MDPRALRESWECLVYLESRVTEDNLEYPDLWEPLVSTASTAVTEPMVFLESMGAMDLRERWETMERLVFLE